MRENLLNAASYTTAYLFLSAAFAFAVTIVLGYTTWTTYEAFRGLEHEDLALLETLGAIVHLDEVLTMSARMAAATGDERWTRRYREAEPRLDAAIERAQRYAPGAQELEFIQSTDEANRRLVELEQRCLALASEGRLPEASSCVSSAEYEQLKSQYMHGAVRSYDVCNQRIERSRRLHRRATLANGALALTAALSGLALLAAFVRESARRHIRRHDMQVVMRRSTLGELAAALAHELNQPLAAIVNYCGAAERLLEPAESAPRALEAVRCADLQARRAGEIIARIRSFARGDAVAMAPTDMADVVKDAASLVRLEAGAAGVSLRAAARGEAVVMGDAVQLQQVLVNLMLNAIDATRDAPGGQIVVALESSADKASVEVRDNGAGVAKGHEKHIFDAFHSTKPGGLGLGLTISRAIVDDHGGALTMRREHGWTAFRVEMPLATSGA